ncbi:hypothetical protein Tco_0724044, partial [Tanacetum coccineum]
TMTDAVHAPAMAPPVRTVEQILPRIRWVPIGKSNCYLNEEKSQPNPIYKISVDILKQTNFFKAFTASSTIPAIYIQQFWDTICFDNKSGSYKILDEERCCQKQGVHVRYPETAKDTTYLPESRELCWWTDSRRRLPVTEENRMRGSISYMLL